MAGSIPVEKLISAAREAGIPVKKQAAFYKIGVGGRAVYVTKTQKVSRVDISGFDFRHPAVTHIGAAEAKKLKLGKVRAQLNFDKPEEQVLEAFQTALGLMQYGAGQKTKLHLTDQLTKQMDRWVALAEKEKAAAMPTKGGRRTLAAGAGGTASAQA